MSSVPVSMNELEEVVGLCSRDLVEKWAVEGEIPNDEMAEYTQLAIDTVAFIIDSFMGYMNDIMEQKENSF